MMLAPEPWPSLQAAIQVFGTSAAAALRKRIGLNSEALEPYSVEARGARGPRATQGIPVQE